MQLKGSCQFDGVCESHAIEGSSFCRSITFQGTFDTGDVAAQNRHGMTYSVPAISRLVRKRGGRDGNTGSFDEGVAGKSFLIGDVGVAAGMARWMGNSE